MVEMKLYKTKLCMLYQRGRCPRQSCSFAHGNAELRRFSESAGGGRRDFHGRDLREKLDRRRSPVGRYSYDRDARERHSSRGHSPTESVGRRSDRKRRMKHYSDGQSDISGSLNILDGTGDHVKDKNHLSSNSRDVLQLRQLQSEISELDGQKQQLEIYLEETTHQADSLALKIQELEMEFSKEKEECKRITSKVKKFVEAYNNRSRLEGELKRSEAQLQKFANKLSSNLARTGISGEDSAINTSDGGMTGTHFSTLDEQQKNTSPTKKRTRIQREANESSNQASMKGKGNDLLRTAYPTQSSKEKKGKTEFNQENGYNTLAGEEKSKKGTGDMNFTTKQKASDIAVVLPSTGMAAHAADEDVEVAEVEEKLDVAGNGTRRAEKGTPSGISEYPFLPPPPPLPPQGTAYLQQYKGDNADGVDEETVEVDIV